MGRLNSRKKGHDMERKIMHELRELGYECFTSRNESKRMDDLKVDLIDNTPFYFQIKSVERLSPGYHDILKSMPDDKVRAVLHKVNNKGTVAVLSWDDFKRLLLKKNNDG